MDERQEDTLHGAVRDTGTLPTESEQAEPARPPTADLIPTGTVGAAPEERAATPPRVPGDTAADSIAGTRGFEPGADVTRYDVERDVSSGESRRPDIETAH